MKYWYYSYRFQNVQGKIVYGTGVAAFKGKFFPIYRTLKGLSESLIPHDSSSKLDQIQIEFYNEISASDFQKLYVVMKSENPDENK